MLQSSHSDQKSYWIGQRQVPLFIDISLQFHKGINHLRATVPKGRSHPQDVGEIHLVVSQFQPISKR